MRLAPQRKAHKSGCSAFTISFWFRKVPRVKTHVPVLRFLLVAHVLFPEQVVASVVIIGDGNIERTVLAHIVGLCHLYIDRTDLRVGDGG